MAGSTSTMDALLLSWLLSTMSESMVTQCVLEGLPSEYESFVTGIHMRSTPCTIFELEPLLIAQEIRVEKSFKAVIESPSANMLLLLTPKIRTNLRINLLKISPVTVNTLTEEEEDKVLDEAGVEYNQQLRQRSSANMASMIASPELLSDSSWFPDSGATNHVTADGNNLMTSSEYMGPEQLHMGNGAGLAISSIGHAFVKTSSHPSSSLSLNQLLHDTREILLRGSVRPDGLYYFHDFHLQHLPSAPSLPSRSILSSSHPSTVSSAHFASTVSSPQTCNTYSLWHNRLGHANRQVVTNHNTLPVPAFHLQPQRFWSREKNREVDAAVRESTNAGAVRGSTNAGDSDLFDALIQL
ncbi:Retrovirus-related Pol polyprotein from transposon TNT 1-94 [Senna tora]|uniref:Retrovirus-related Pol polyprotein from transposon TNT 1-94 n=1 Tax=Senna tora TaxID=362788 RepID=A0A834TQY1_9FABA|nr:Retrovirus-related Pol polyprotein from transposon TNT 1-94 [Senna tora]